MKKILTALSLLTLTSCGSGPQGGVGPQGPVGPIGSQGPTGMSIVSATVPDTSGKCTNGGVVILMAQDAQRSGVWEPFDTNQSASIICNGVNGNNGTNGSNGVNATPVTVVKLCPGNISYPSVFIETALCLNNTLYGVYSVNGGFLTELSPGQYSSDGVGSSCTFTVGANCTITQ